MWWEERYWLLLDGEWEEGNRAPLVTVAQWVVSSSPALLSAVTGLRGRGTGLPLSLSTPSLLPFSSFLPTAAFFLQSSISHAVLWVRGVPLIVSPTALHPLHVLRREFLSATVGRVTTFSLLSLLYPLCLLFTSFHLALIPQHDGSRSSHFPLMSRTSFRTVFLLLLCS